jgi:hypothetical protein
MLMGRCVRCRWWETNDECPPGWGSCVLLSVEDRPRVGQVPGDVLKARTRRSAYATTAEGGDVTMRTKGDFGCCHWTAAPLGGRR